MPQIAYSDRDFATLKAAMFAAVPELAPAWTNLNEGDMGVALINLMAGVGDMMSYYVDRNADETFLSSVVQRTNMKRLVELIDYQLARPVAATTLLRFSLPAPATSTLVIPKYTQVKTNDGVYFVTKTDATIFVGQTSTDVLGYQGQYQLDAFTGNGQASQLLSLSRPNLAQNFFDVYVGNILWQEDGSGVSPALDAVYKVQTDDSEQSSLVFSSFLSTVPPQNTPVVVNSISTSGGAGNIGAGLVTKIASTIAGGSTLTVTNVSAASGGRDRESIDEARITAPRNLRRLGRVVSLPDYTDAMESIINVVASQAINHNGYVECYVAPAGGGALFVVPPVIAASAVSGGTFAAGTYKVAVTAVDAFGETTTVDFTQATRAPLDRSQSVVLTSGQAASVAITNVAGAVTYRAYASNDGGGTWHQVPGSITPSGGSTTTTVIAAMPTSAAVSLPAVNTTGVRSADGTQSLSQAVGAYLDANRALCTVFTIFNPTYVPVAVTASIKLFDNYSQADRSGAVQTALASFFVSGTLTFGEHVTLSALYSLLMGVDGVRSVNFTLPTDDVVITDGQIATLGTVSLTMVGGVA